ADDELYSSDGSDIKRHDKDEVHMSEKNADSDDEVDVVQDTIFEGDRQDGDRGNQVNKNSKEEEKGSSNSGHFKKSGCPRTDGSMLDVLEEVIKVGKVMGKESVTISDYFVIIRGIWCLTRKKFIMIAVYAPQDSKEKNTLWDYLHHEISK
nr:RNA-directed DNA polymerase, eukaryota [Tanacetum cinerariifolium]